MVEAWRLNKQSLYEKLPADMQLHLFLIFTGDKLPEYSAIEAAMVATIDKLAELHLPNKADA